MADFKRFLKGSIASPSDKSPKPEANNLDLRYLHECFVGTLVSTDFFLINCDFKRISLWSRATVVDLLRFSEKKIAPWDCTLIFGASLSPRSITGMIPSGAFWKFDLHPPFGLFMPLEVFRSVYFVFFDVRYVEDLSSCVRVSLNVNAVFLNSLLGSIVDYPFCFLTGSEMRAFPCDFFASYPAFSRDQLFWFASFDCLRH